MHRRRQTNNRLFLFDLAHQDFVDGIEQTFPTAITRKIAMRQYAYLMFLIASPMIITITVLVAIAGYQIEFLLIVELITALIVCAYFVLRRFLKDRELQYKGTILYGEVIRQDILPGYSNIGSSMSTRILYRFMNPDSERVIACIDLSHEMHRLPDGRKYPDAGTPIAVLYANNKNHKLL